MSIAHKLVPLPESRRPTAPAAAVVGDVNPNEVFEITVTVRPRSATAEEKNALIKQIESQPPGKREYLSREDFAKRFGADPADLEKVEQYARENHLTVVATDPPARTLTLRGTAQQLTTAFPTDLKQYEWAAGRFRGRTGVIQIPEDLQGIIEGIFGFDNRPQAEAR
jgi:kumamolisin